MANRCVDPVDLTIEDEYDPEKLVYSLKQGLSIKDVQTQGSVFDLDMKKDLEDMSFPSGKEYFDNESMFEDLTYPDESESDSEGQQDDREPFQKIATRMQPVTEDKGVLKRVRKPGYGGLPPEKAQVTVHYNAYLEYLDEPFDSTRLRNRPTKFILDDGSTVPGFHTAVATMRQNEVAEFLIHPKYAFGEMGCPPRIPASATILYVIELLRFEDYAAVVEFNQMSSEERLAASFEKVMAVSKNCNREANELLNSKQYHRAMKLYNKAIKLLSEVNMADQEEEDEQQKLLCKVYCNLSQCHLFMNCPDRAIPVAISALKIEPTNVKALFRCGKAHRLNGRFDMAKQYLQKAALQQPSKADIIKELQLLQRDIQRYKQIQKQMATRICAGMHLTPPAKPSTDAAKEVTVAEELKGLVENLKEFMESELEYLPFTAGFSDSEIQTIRRIATDMGLHCVVPEHGDAKLRIYRVKPEE